MATRATSTADSAGKTKLYQTWARRRARARAQRFAQRFSSFLHHLACMHSYETSMQLCLEKAQIAHSCYVRRSLATRDVSALAQPRAEAPGGHWQPQARFQPQRRALLQVVMLS
jgi:hypothetical protein